MSYQLVMDIGGTFLKYVLMTSHGEIKHRGKFSTYKASAEGVVSSVVMLMENCLSDGWELDGIAISLPGIVDGQHGVWIHSDAFGVRNENLVERLHSASGLRVSIENDVNCAALGEQSHGAAVGTKNFICLAIGSGIGGGIVANNQLIRGTSFVAGEFGFMLTEGLPTGEVVTDGLSGIAFHALRKQVALKKRISPEYVDGHDLFDKAEAGQQPEAREVERFYNRLAFGLFNLASCFNPEKILIGGAVSQRAGLVDEIRRRVELLSAEAAPFIMASTAIEPCLLGNDAALYGAKSHWESMHGAMTSQAA